MKIKRNDTVLIIAGKETGKKGTVSKIFRKQNKIVVEGINIRTKHIKKTTTRKGERIQFPGPFNASNVKIICPECNKAVRIGYQLPENGKKQRICKKCRAILDKPTPSVKKK